MRLVTFGCSYTYGHGLSDCLDNDGNPGPTPSKLSFSSLAAKKLNCEYINLGKSGNSNKEIWNDILNFKFQKNDIAITTWTYYSRFCIIKSDSIRRINPWIDEEKIFYMNYSNRYDMILDFFNRLNHSNFYLKSIGIKNYNYIIENLDDLEPSWNKIAILGLFEKIDKADDGCHPGPISHSIFAGNIYNHIVG
jgi:hypothetical protein